MIRVYHNPHFCNGMRYYQESVSLKDISLASLESKLIAVVETDCLETAYRLTQNIDSAWIKNNGVTLINAGEQRSTSVGDLLQTQLGEVWMVAPVGFTKI